MLSWNITTSLMGQSFWKRLYDAFGVHDNVTDAWFRHLSDFNYLRKSKNSFIRIFYTIIHLIPTKLVRYTPSRFKNWFENTAKFMYCVSHSILVLTKFWTVLRVLYKDKTFQVPSSNQMKKMGNFCNREFTTRSVLPRSAFALVKQTQNVMLSS